MSDSMVGNRKFRTLNVMDDCSREALAIEIDTSSALINFRRHSDEHYHHPYKVALRMKLDNGEGKGADKDSCLHRNEKSFLERKIFLSTKNTKIYATAPPPPKC